VNRWKRKVEALIRLAEDQKGRPEGDLARAKLIQILDRYPEARQYSPVVDLMQRELTMRDVAEMRRNGISTDGSWTGRNLSDAIFLMEQEYKRRMAAYQRRGRVEDPRKRLLRRLVHAAG